MIKSICIAPVEKPEIAFVELHETWTSEGGVWRVEAKVESVESLPKYKVRTVTIYKRNKHTLQYTQLHPDSDFHIPQTVLNKYDEFISLANEVR